MVYIFRCEQFRNFELWDTSVLCCSPGECIVQSVDEHTVALLEKTIIPLASGSKQVHVELTPNIRSFIEDCEILEISSDEIKFDNKISMKYNAGCRLDSKKGKNAFITEIDTTFNDCVFEYKNGILYICSEDVKVTLDIIYKKTKDKHIVNTVKGTFLDKYAPKGPVKLYLENEYPICIEQESYRVYIAPCQ